ncbi:Phosphatidylinositolglycan class N-domain-containing protein [Amanita rubescens]|nr:Phosphatidylinositolglycan class N-domain-containing protein [Amanita rubescens]
MSSQPTSASPPAPTNNARTDSKSRKNSKKSIDGIARLLVLALVFHLVYIGTVFDCYFTSPVVHGMQRYKVDGNGSSTNANAKRVVLIVGDGLRADLLFTPNVFQFDGAPSVVAPYLRSIVEKRGAFGISHTHVPTESRPGHVAIIGGMYEDVSAVDFDSVFNQSSTTFSFGSPDILPMFAHGAMPEKVKTWCYSGNDEDFTKDATALDLWVLDQLQVLFKNATTDAHLYEQLHSEGVVFFLHLLGLDTTGHSYRPHSKEYMNNIVVVDTIVQKVESLFNSFYNGDNDTSYVFTADHGMSVIGNHGDGHPDNTRTPLVAWGKGVRGPLQDTTPSSHDEYSRTWGLTHLLRRDVEQADIASLMSTLVGSNWPVNSVGVLPDVDPSRPGYLDPEVFDDETVARAALVNAKVILEHYRVKHELKESRTLFYKPFPSLFSPHALSSRILEIENLITRKQWYAARLKSGEAIQIGLDGLHYLQTYDRVLIRSIVSTAYLGWAAYGALYILGFHKDPSLADSNSPFRTSVIKFAINVFSLFVTIVSWILFALQRSPWTFYLYILFPCYFWNQVLLKVVPRVAQWSWSDLSSIDFGRMIGVGVLVVGSLQAMVLGYTHRSIWSVGFFIIGIVWPLTWPVALRQENTAAALVWGVSCAVTGVFPLLPVNMTESLIMIEMGGVVMLVVGRVCMPYVVRSVEKRNGTKDAEELKKRLRVQMALIIMAMITTASSARNLQAKLGLPLHNQVIGWAVLVVSATLPFLHLPMHRTISSRVLTYFLGFGPCFVILSISAEGMFYSAYSVTLVMWILVEGIVRKYRQAVSIGTLSPAVASSASTTSNSSSDGGKEGQTKPGGYRFQLDDLRIALFFLFFVQVGFFGTGKSFYLEPVYRLIPKFSPFFMTALLIFKIIVPYIILSVTFAVLNSTLQLPPFSLLLVALTLTDGMTLTFFFQVQDTGSWLEIGQSISFFCITSLLLLWSAGICALGEYLAADVIVSSRSRTQGRSSRGKVKMN